MPAFAHDADITPLATRFRCFHAAPPRHVSRATPTPYYMPFRQPAAAFLRRLISLLRHTLIDERYVTPALFFHAAAAFAIIFRFHDGTYALILFRRFSPLSPLLPFHFHHAFFSLLFFACYRLATYCTLSIR